MFMVIIGFIILAVFGFLSIFYPEIMWHIEHLFDVKGGEPTDWYIQKCRLRGLLFWIIDIVIIGTVIWGYFNGILAF